MKNALTAYINAALKRKAIEKIADDSFFGKIPGCEGVVASAPTFVECESELASVLEEWILMGLKLGHPLPLIDGIDLNKIPEPVAV